MMMNFFFKYNLYQFNLASLKFNFNDTLVICSIILSILVISIFFMNNTSILRHIGFQIPTPNEMRNWDNRKERLYRKLVIQSVVNDIRANNNQNPLSYNEFFDTHPAHLTWDDRLLLTNMVRFTAISYARAAYKLSSNNTNFYYRGPGYVHPCSSPLLLTVVRLG